MRQRLPNLTEALQVNMRDLEYIILVYGIAKRLMEGWGRYRSAALAPASHLARIENRRSSRLLACLPHF